MAQQNHAEQNPETSSSAQLIERVTDKATNVARDANDHPVVRAMARTGYAASGLIHLLIAWLAARIAWGGSGRADTADQSGALRSIAAQPWGRPLLWVLVAGFVGLALWQFTEAIGGWHGHGRDAVASRVKALSKAVVYLLLGWTSLVFARGGSSDSGGDSAAATSDLLAKPGGRGLVVVVGLVVLGVGIYHIVKGAQRRFRQDLVGDPGRVAVAAGITGYVAKGIALCVVAGLLVSSGMAGNVRQARGLDGALRAVANTPHGTWLLSLVALGLAGYAVYSMFRVRYTKV